MSARLRDAHDLDDTDPESYSRCKSVKRIEPQREKSPETPKQKKHSDSRPCVHPKLTVNVKQHFSYPFFDLNEFFFKMRDDNPKCKLSV